jgi:hypothetical protein
MARLQMFEKPPLRYTDELRAMLSLAAPLVGANLLQMAVFAVDVVFVARLGPVALAAASLSVSLFGLLIWSLSGLVGAAAPLVAAELGQRRHAVREVRRTVRMTGLAGLLGAIVAMGICLLGEPLMRITASRKMSSPRWRSWVNACRGQLGNAFVFGNLGAPEMGLLGSALASVITSVVTLLAYVAAIQTNRRLRRYRLFGRWWRPEWRGCARSAHRHADRPDADGRGGLFSGAAFLMGRIGAPNWPRTPSRCRSPRSSSRCPSASRRRRRSGSAITSARATTAGRSPGRAARAGDAGDRLHGACRRSCCWRCPRLCLSAYVDAMRPANAALMAWRCSTWRRRRVPAVRWRAGRGRRAAARACRTRACRWSDRARRILAPGFRHGHGARLWHPACAASACGSACGRGWWWLRHCCWCGAGAARTSGSGSGEPILNAGLKKFSRRIA